MTDSDKNLKHHVEQKLNLQKKWNFAREDFNSDPLKKVFAAHKGGQTRKAASKNNKVSLPKFSWDKES